MCINPRIIIKKNKINEKIYYKYNLDYDNNYNNNLIEKQLKVSCGKCIECRTKQARAWTQRLYLESLNYTKSCFITLTFSDDKLLEKQKEDKKYKYWLMRNDLYYSKIYFQKWIKKLRERIRRKYNTQIKYFHVGEYGSVNKRPHHHILILGYLPSDFEIIMEKSKSGKEMGYSNIINDTWKLGKTAVQECNTNIIKYICQYTTEKILNENKNKIQDTYFTYSNRGMIGNTQLILNAETIIENEGITIENKKYALTTNQINYLRNLKETDEWKNKIDNLKEERKNKAMEHEKELNKQYISKQDRRRQKEIICKIMQKQKARYK